MKNNSSVSVWNGTEIYPKNIFKSPEFASKNLGVLVLRIFFNTETPHKTYLLYADSWFNALAFLMFSSAFPIKEPLFLLPASSNSPSSLLSKH